MTERISESYHQVETAGPLRVKFVGGFYASQATRWMLLDPQRKLEIQGFLGVIVSALFPPIALRLRIWDTSLARVLGFSCSLT